MPPILRFKKNREAERGFWGRTGGARFHLCYIPFFSITLLCPPRSNIVSDRSCQPRIFLVLLDHIHVTIIGADGPGRAGRESARTQRLF